MWPRTIFYGTCRDSGGVGVEAALAVIVLAAGENMEAAATLFMDDRGKMWYFGPAAMKSARSG